MSHPNNREVALALAHHRADFLSSVAEVLSHWLTDTDARAVARYLVTLLQGFSIQASDGAGQADLQPTIELAVSTIGQCCPSKSSQLKLVAAKENVSSLDSADEFLD